jgi:hypothetical protein
MALRATTKLVPQPSSTTRPVNASFTFDVTVVDRQATAPTSRTLELVLSEENDLVFGNNTKAFSQDVVVGEEEVPVTFVTRVKGPARDLAAFQVALSAETSAHLPVCRIRVS